MARNQERPARASGRSARRRERSAIVHQALPAAVRRIGTLDILSEEVRDLILDCAERLLQEVGVDFVDAAAAAERWREAGAEVTLTAQSERETRFRILIPKGLTRQLLKTLPSEFVQAARNPQRSVTLGGKHMVFAPVYGPPFVRDLEKGRRYGTLADFERFVRLVYLLPSLHHSGGTLCEPVDRPVNKRHLDMLYAHFKYSDKPLMGSVTAPERAADSVAMAQLVFGEAFVDANACLLSLINVNSPLAFDATMLGALEGYAAANQAVIVSPFLIAGAMAPTTTAGVMVQASAEALVGLAHTQLVRPGAPAIFGTFAASMSMQSGAPTFGTPEPALIMYGMAQIARKLGLPFRSGGGLTAAKLPDAQAAYESQQSLFASVTAGVNFMLHGAGWLEGGLVSSYEKLVMDADQLGAYQKMLTGVAADANGLAMDAFREVGPGGHYLGAEHTKANYRDAFYQPELHDASAFEQWEAEGGSDMAQRAQARVRALLADYQPPALDPGIDEALQDFIARRKGEMPDRAY